MNTDKNKNKWIKIIELEIGVNIKKSKEVGERQEKKKDNYSGRKGSKRDRGRGMKIYTK